MPVSGTNSPAIPAACGSCSRSCSRIEPLEPREAVVASPAFELVEPRELTLRHGHDHLAATLVRDPVLRGEEEEGLPSRGAQPGLARTGFVVEAGVDDAAVVAGLVKGQALFRLEHQAAQPMIRGERARRGEADDSTAYHDDIERAAHRLILAYRPRNALLHCRARRNLLQ